MFLMNAFRTKRALATLAASMLTLTAALAQEPAKSYSPYVGEDYPDNVYWGDTSLHTSLSSDAFSFGTTLTPEDAYRFARGETVKADNGAPLRIRRPLDFLAVTDHAENMGVLKAGETGDPALALLSTDNRNRVKETLSKALPWVEQYRKSRGKRSAEDQKSRMSLASLGSPSVGAIDGVEFRRRVWENVINAAERYNDPGKFTAFIGYEWTSKYVGSQVVLFKDGASKAKAVLPFSAFDSVRVEDLWAYMDDYEKKTGGEILAIPQNPDLTKGRMFLTRDSDGNPFTHAYAQRRVRFGPLLDVTQNKGDTETHPELSPNDEFADYGRRGDGFGLKYSYARSALKLGLEQESELGVNPFKFGLIGSTSSHTGFAESAPENFWARRPLEPSFFMAAYGGDFPPPNSQARRISPDPDAYYPTKKPISGYAAVWAKENTRQALFAAMKRKETYATTGPRMEVRFFGGWDYTPADAFRPDLARIGYKKGVPMGGDLAHAPKGKAPSFLIRAVKDADGANLDRVQVIKGWLDAKGATHEKIYNVALSDGRKEKNGKVPPVGSTVDVKDASYTNSIGDPELATVWTDPGFNPKARAFYYVRVLAIPTPLWTAHYAKFFGLKDVPPEIPMTAQERAYTSPIWYTPQHNGSEGR